MKELGILLLIVLVIASVIFAPLALIWSLNTLFPILNIPFAFSTWAAAMFILALFSGPSIKKNQN